ncbi:threonine ammonia-lyase [Pelotomaculum terephthalicicum JT]|uniref:threonine ammonia-lyase n=1 Tax=Pelotomaculum TaxID=191373 RepID=UPI0009CAE3F2|nr:MULTISPECIES: threonine ammonia-lyase [Pelotomaculum]MCG9969020.1 threonine ammonia-lyase [Pelotomaculum terephthalicicum JT]OPX91376.1 MAG: L-threonine dehydratase catabolic TdcB [Pelotomaculum sp. PtaB.Bin117]OPY60589.1 MAG: L-threonine dehydratase catabolic TdcB [Pelotomaculum sp. PtaU1.Bin065]
MAAERLSMEKIRLARDRLVGIARRTPLDYSTTFSKVTGNSVYLKLENMQKTGSFKIRGAYNKVMSLGKAERDLGVIAASAGNHAQGVAYAAAVAGIRCTVVMPAGAPISKVVATQGYGAEVILAGGGYDEAYRLARKLQGKSGAVFVHGFNDPDVIAGQATIALELLEELPGVEAVLVPAGGGGLLAGIAFALKEIKPSVRVIGVQAGGAPAMHCSYKEGRLHKVKGAGTFADGIAVQEPGKNTFALIKRYVDEFAVVDDEEIASAILMLLERAKIVVEGAGAVGLAALIHKKIALENVKTAVILSGGNIDVNILSIIIERGLAKTGRYVRLRTILTDRPGSLLKLLSVVAEARANVISVSHDRIKQGIPLKQAEVELSLETRNKEHIEQVIACLAAAGYMPEIFS